MKIKNILIAALLAGATINVSAAESTGEVKTPAAQSHDELLQLVKQNKIRQTNVNKEREAIFARERNRQ